MKALVLDGDSRAALAIVRSLGKRGVHVTVAAEYQPCLAGCSRWSSAALTYPCPRTSPRWFRNWLVFTLGSSPDTMLYTCSDITTSIVGKCRSGLPSSTRILMPPQGSLEIALDKSKTLALAHDLGVPIPRSVEFRRNEPIEVDSVPFGFPMAIKASQSDLPHRLATIYAQDPGELGVAVTEVLRDSESALAQEVVTGEGTAVFVLFDSGEPLVTFAHRRIREKPPWGGVSVLSQSIDPSPEMLDHSLKLLSDLRWHGVAMVEFKRDSAGTPVLMEINPRFWGSLELAVKCGVDFPYLAMQLANGQMLDAPHPRHGVNRWMLGELDSFLTAIRTRSPGGSCAIEPLRRLWDLRFGLCCEVERAGDPRPAFYEYSSWLKTTVCRVTSGLKGDTARCGKPVAPEG